MITKVTTVEELKKLYTKVLLSKTDKITKVSDESVTGAIAYGLSKVSQKALKDIALVETHLFPEDAYGENLDTIASRQGVTPGRQGVSGSSVYLRLVAVPGTQYLLSQHTFIGQGTVFELPSDITIGPEGYTYVRVRSVDQGSRTNVNSLLIDRVVNEPEGHISVINEFRAQGGRDIEDDEVFRDRITNYPNLVSRDTLSHMTVVIQRINPQVCRVYKKGFTSTGKIVLGVMLYNGAFLSLGELESLLQSITPYLPLNLVSAIGSPQVVLQNCDYKPIDISFRLRYASSSNLTQLRLDLQNKISKYLDMRFWDNRAVQWEYLLNIISSHPDVILLPEQYFSPGSDIMCYLGEYPRVRSFRMFDLDGNLLSENTNSFEPVLYANSVIYDI